MREFEVQNTHMKGTKLVNSIDEQELKNINENFLLKSRFLVCHSTHQEEDIFVLKLI